MIDWADGPGRQSDARLLGVWSAQHVALGGYHSIGDLVRAGWSDADVAGDLLDALADTTDRVRAAEVSLAILAPLPPKVS